MGTTFIVEQHLDYQQHFHLWDSEESELELKLFSKNLALRKEKNHFLLTENKAYIGLNTGLIIEVEYDSSNGAVLPTKKELGTRTYLKNAAPITGLAMFDGEVYDSSAQGLFRTHEDFCEDRRNILAIEMYNNSLDIIPWFGLVGGNQIGDLVDAKTGDTLISEVRIPTDENIIGEHLINNGIVYSRYGKNLEEIAVKPTDGSSKAISFHSKNTFGFIAHRDDVYTVYRKRNHPMLPLQFQLIIDYDANTEFLDTGSRTVLFETPRNLLQQELTSIVSDGKSLIMSFYNANNNSSSIIRSNDPHNYFMKLAGEIIISEPIIPITFP